MYGQSIMMPLNFCFGFELMVKLYTLPYNIIYKPVTGGYRLLIEQEYLIFGGKVWGYTDIPSSEAQSPVIETNSHEPTKPAN